MHLNMGVQISSPAHPPRCHWRCRLVTHVLERERRSRNKRSDGGDTATVANSETVTVIVDGTGVPIGYTWRAHERTLAEPTVQAMGMLRSPDLSPPRPNEVVADNADCKLHFAGTCVGTAAHSLCQPRHNARIRNQCTEVLSASVKATITSRTENGASGGCIRTVD